MRSELDRLCEKLRITATCKFGEAKENPTFRDSHGYKVTLRYGRRSLTVDFYQGSAHTKEPTPADVLNCLCSDAQVPEDIGEFADEFGYTDIKECLRIHKACMAMAPRVRRFLGGSFDIVARAEH